MKTCDDIPKQLSHLDGVTDLIFEKVLERTGNVVSTWEIVASPGGAVALINVVDDDLEEVEHQSGHSNPSEALAEALALACGETKDDTP